MDLKVRNKRRNIFYQIIFIVGCFTLAWEIVIYRKTIISSNLLLIVITGVGILATFLDFENYRRTYELKGFKLYLLALIQNTVSWGFIVCSILVFSNFYLAKGEIIEEKYEIVERSSLPGSKGSRSKRKPLVTIRYSGEIKELVFSNKFYRELEEFNFVILQVKQGFLNWDVIENQKLIK